MASPTGPSAYDLLTAELEGAVARIRTFTHAQPARINDALGECARSLERFPDEPRLQLYWASLVMEADMPWDEARHQISQSIVALTRSQTDYPLLSMTSDKIARRFRSTMTRCAIRDWFVERDGLLAIAFNYNPHDEKLLGMMQARSHYKDKKRRRNRAGRKHNRQEP